jgi:osmotically-inducible protein OsmY
VEGGLVTISGAVGTSREYAVAEEAARSMRGVRDVLNLLIIDRDAQDEDEAMQREIQSAIDEVEELCGAGISVAVSGDLIVLTGHVPHWRQRELAGEVALGIRPWRLRNEITVVETPSTT